MSGRLWRGLRRRDIGGVSDYSVLNELYIDHACPLVGDLS
jgi:hypothetical protein